MTDYYDRTRSEGQKYYNQQQEYFKQDNLNKSYSSYSDKTTSNSSSSNLWGNSKKNYNQSISLLEIIKIGLKVFYVTLILGFWQLMLVATLFSEIDLFEKIKTFGNFIVNKAEGIGIGIFLIIWIGIMIFNLIIHFKYIKPFLEEKKKIKKDLDY
ncbi:MAG: hypothetical protein KBA47_01555 [Caldisericia bacterium]|nr:hypothetical protein [Caldisericia bacterium]